MRSSKLGLAHAILACLAATAPAYADPGPDYSAYGVGKFLTYTNAPPASGTLSVVPKLTISFGGKKTYAIEMDTGSTGIVASADQLPAYGGVLCDKCLTYSSSGRTYSGTWVTLPVTIWGDNDASVTTAPIPVLAVSSVTTCARNKPCTTVNQPEGIDVMGVGFAREYDHMPEGTPDKNPFLHVPGPGDVPVRRGYVVTSTGVHVGLTRANTRGDFHFVKLAADQQISSEWQPAPACIVVNAPAAASCGSALIDTGVSSMFVTLPPAAVTGATGTDGQLVDGTRLDVTFPGADGSPEEAYSLTVGTTDAPVAPEAVRLNTTRWPPAFVNTGLHVLNGFDVLFDADGGFVAYRPR